MPSRPGFNPRSSQTKDSKKWYFMPPCLTLSIIRYISRVKWSNSGKGVAPSRILWCSSYWKRNFESSSTTVANFTYLLYMHGDINTYMYRCLVVHTLLPPKAPFSTWPWEQTSCLLCELRVNFSLLFALGHFEYYLARLIVCSSLTPFFGLIIWVETTTILVRWCWCLWQFT